MRHAIYFDPHEFDPPESEQHLEVHWGTSWTSLEWLLLSLELIMEKSGSMMELSVWREQASKLLRTPLKPHVTELEFVKRGWVARDSGDEFIIVGEGRGQWVLLNWYTTA
ncbi:hypothetical protein [Deinococcus humi]|uniref:Uncharacterized protein n=1 Tax=Deinococcus humi TaxID=662880 RepID=A0A7W8JT77_9DEIO|nr:hypothetical protein [Deinococcus humi]MBB5362500.1 hypothetical protein [Deinococcus humi]GGO28523.1 hypothetical protein GCM10008949_21210 [Deinococcus humi]